MPPSSQPQSNPTGLSYDFFSASSIGQEYGGEIMVAAQGAFQGAFRGTRRLLSPGRECFVESALARGAFFDGDDGAALVDVDQRHVEPRALLQELQVAGAVGLDIRQA